MVTIDINSKVAHRTRASISSTLSSDIPWSHLIYFLPLVAVILRALYRAYGTTLRDIPGPWQARYTRLWLLRAISSRSFQKINLDLHRQYGS